VGKARLECILEGEQPTNLNVARRAGITIEKLAKLKAKTRKPQSMQDQVWSNDAVTFQVLPFPATFINHNRLAKKTAVIVSQ
jgi:hypothetical protein